MESPIIALDFKKPCPKCDQPPVKKQLGYQGAIYINENRQEMAIKCSNCNTMLDMKLTKEQYAQVYEQLKGYAIPIN